TALPPVPRQNPDNELATNSISKSALLQAAQAEALKLGNTPSGSAPVDQPTSIKVATVKIETIPAAAVDTSAPSSGAASVLPVEDKDDTVTVATSDTPDIEPGWQVQIAAAETEGQAITMLKKAKTKTGSALRGHSPYTEPVEANGQTLYRARFVGFETKTAAWNACKTLKRAKFACFAIYQ
ncbi:MAG: SPOR domain-containing protein, partial [Roseibium sp.]|uniref:SPOR domain-containing protein n=1 Tax=Roseibium sp. TaxID=1936156 RepID=UPI0026053833